MLTPVNPENLNQVKAWFDQAAGPSGDNQQQRVGINLSRVVAVLDGGEMSVKASRLIKRTCGRREEGWMTFGEFAVLVRGGRDGLLPPREADIFRQGLMHAPPPSARVRVADLWIGSSEDEVLDCLHAAFMHHDEGDTGILEWEKVRFVVEEMVQKLPEVDVQKAALAVSQIPSSPPTVLLREVDFEDW